MEKQRQPYQTPGSNSKSNYNRYWFAIAAFAACFWLLAIKYRNDQEKKTFDANVQQIVKEGLNQD